MLGVTATGKTTSEARDRIRKGSFSQEGQLPARHCTVPPLTDAPLPALSAGGSDGVQGGGRHQVAGGVQPKGHRLPRDCEGEGGLRLMM